QRQVVEIRETASEQREELSAAISALGNKADGLHEETLQQLADVRQISSKQRVEYTSSIDQLERKTDCQISNLIKEKEELQIQLNATQKKNKIYFIIAYLIGVLGISLSILSFLLK
ncbi:MAG: hypothetical protein K2M83_11110, partial [Muribaculaceae bacterium]|nr:hypothetical protein [Muribaculaceae bacterium]